MFEVSTVFTRTTTEDGESYLYRVNARGESGRLATISASALVVVGMSLAPGLGSKLII